MASGLARRAAMPAAARFWQLYRFSLACAVALALYVVARAPLWSPVLAGARVQLDTGPLALVAGSFRCTERTRVCSTVVAGAPLVVELGSLSDAPYRCTVRFMGSHVPCATQAWYAPRLKPFLEIGKLPHVALADALREAPWRLLDQGLLGEAGPLHMYAGMALALLIALGATMRLRGGALWLVARCVLVATAFVALSAGWFVACVFLGYID